MFAGGDRRRLQAGGARLPDVAHRALEGFAVRVPRQLGEELVLALREGLDRAVAQRDAARVEERPDPVDGRLALQVRAVIVDLVERDEGLPGGLGALPQVMVEQLLPGLGVQLRGEARRRR